MAAVVVIHIELDEKGDVQITGQLPPQAYVALGLLEVARDGITKTYAKPNERIAEPTAAERLALAGRFGK